MRRGRFGLALAALLALLQTGAAAVPDAAPVVYLVSHGWHVGLVLRRDDLAPLSRPLRLPLPPTDNVEVGWGDGDFYPAAHGTVALALRAAFCSRSSVLHVAGFDGAVSAMFPGRKIVAVELTPPGFAALTRYVEASLAVAGDGRFTVVAPPLYGSGAFYLARRRYRVLDNSNTWAARALRVSGCAMEVETTITAGTVLQQAERAGRCAEPG
jgi:uncharacterized protein (TIGR02117 family)